jgi:hypothetical protein
MVEIEDWEHAHGVQLPAQPDRPAGEWGSVPSDYI